MISPRILAAAVPLLLLAGCATAAPTASTTPPRTSRTSTPSPTASATSTPLPTVARSTEACQFASPAALDPNPEIELTNVGTGTCSLQGFPQVVFVDANGAAIEEKTIQDSGADQDPVHPITVAPGGHAYLLVEMGLRAENAGCAPNTDLAGLRITIPGAAGQVAVPLASKYCEPDGDGYRILPITAELA